MHVVLNSAHYNGLAIQTTEDAAQVAMHFLAQSRVAQERPAVLSRKDGVENNLGQRLRQGARMVGSGGGCNSFRVGRLRPGYPG